MEKIKQLFAPVSPDELSLVRAAFFGVMCVHFFPIDFSLWPTVSDAYWLPIVTFWQGSPPPSVMQVAVAQNLWKLSLLFSALGLCTRASTASAFVLGVYILSLRHNWGKLTHSSQLLVMVLAAFVTAKSGATWSLDRLIRVRLGREDAATIPAPSSDYAWPLVFMRTAFALAFFAAGMAKLRHTGLGFVLTDHLRFLMLQYAQWMEMPNPWTPKLASYPALCHLMAFATLCCELSAITMIFSRRIRLPLMLALLAFQAGVYVFMGIEGFVEFMLTYVIMIPWIRLAPKLPHRASVPTENADERTVRRDHAA